MMGDAAAGTIWSNMVGGMCFRKEDSGDAL